MYSPSETKREVVVGRGRAVAKAKAPPLAIALTVWAARQHLRLRQRRLDERRGDEFGQDADRQGIIASLLAPIGFRSSAALQRASAASNLSGAHSKKA